MLTQANNSGSTGAEPDLDLIDITHTRRKADTDVLQAVNSGTTPALYADNHAQHKMHMRSIRILTIHPLLHKLSAHAPNQAKSNMSCGLFRCLRG
ncbi:hypothetical protein B9K09_13390 [Pseudomonas sp. M30-35]|nr:hypothetical protein B9K09_13390 [Pseudomonas sp. M30-35]